MSMRREGREAAVQFLYSRDQNSEPNPSEIELFWSIWDDPRFAREEVSAHGSDVQPASATAKAFAEKLIGGLLPRLDAIDEAIKSALEHWDFARLEVVDRNILRVAIYEMFHCFDTPPIVAINEAIEIAKRLGTPDSARFINGILDRLKNDLRRPLRTGAGVCDAGRTVSQNPATANAGLPGPAVAGVCEAGLPSSPEPAAIDQPLEN
jgi:transcription antitermination protein NusB